MSLKSRLEELERRVERIRPAGGIPDWVTPEALDRMFRRLPADALNEAVELCPSLRGEVEEILAEREREGRTWLN
jgi:hypothetical protein